MEEFEILLKPWRGALERFVHFKVSIKADAEDILQDIYMTAYKNLGSLRDKEAFRAWIFAIAGNKCKDYYAALAKRMELLLEGPEEKQFLGHYGHGKQRALGRQWNGTDGIYAGVMDGPERNYEENFISESVHDTLEKLKDKDKRILYLYFFRELPQADIANELGIPIGTVKSRLHTAKQNFRENYPYNVSLRLEKQDYLEAAKVLSDECGEKERFIMKRFPEWIPEYKIEKWEEEPFPVRWEELLGWFIVPRLGEKSGFAIYDRPYGKCDWLTELEVTGEAEVHGIRGVEISCRSQDYANYRSKEDAQEKAKMQPERILVAQLTDTHSRYLASTEIVNGVKRYSTFLDGDEFNGNWGFGEDNCGKEVNIQPKGDVVRRGNEITFADKKYLLDVVGRYSVTINGKTYDTICVMDIETNVNGTVTEQFIDENGRTVLWRIYCQDNFLYPKYNKLWTEMLPNSERLTVNGLTYVHWYDCITDYIL